MTTDAPSDSSALTAGAGFFGADLEALVRTVLNLALECGVRVVTAESCTGGLIAGALTSVSGSADVVDRGYVTYSNEAKSEMIGVPEALLAQFGAVSEPVAKAMAEGALQRSRAQLSISVTGIAGPTGGTPEKPVGLVHFATALTGGQTRPLRRTFGDIGRDQVRETAVRTALGLLLERLQEVEATGVGRTRS